MMKMNVVVIDYHPDHFLISEVENGVRHLVIVDGLGSRYLDIRYWLRTRIPIYGQKKHALYGKN